MIASAAPRLIFRALAAAALLISLALIDAGVASAAPPSITGTQATHVTSTSATVEAEIDPQGASAGVFYQFQLLLDPGEATTEIACPSSVPGYSVCVGPQDPGALPIEWIPGSGPQTVSLDLSSAGVTLDAGRTYYFRVLAADRVFTEDTVEWESPAVVGTTEDFTTPTVPSVEGESVSNITNTDATLEARINPRGASAGVFYQFQLLLDPGEAPTEIACPSSLPGYSVCVGPQGPGALPLEWIPGDKTQTVKLDLSNAGVTLDPGRTYFFRVLVANRVFSEDTAEWEPPAAVGLSEEFTTHTAPPSTIVPSSCGFSAGPSACPDGPPNPAPACKKSELKRHGKCVEWGHCRHHRRNHHRKHFRSGRLCKH